MTDGLSICREFVKLFVGELNFSGIRLNMITVLVDCYIIILELVKNRYNCLCLVSGIGI